MEIYLNVTNKGLENEDNSKKIAIVLGMLVCIAMSSVAYAGTGELNWDPDAPGADIHDPPITIGAGEAAFFWQDSTVPEPITTPIPSYSDPFTFTSAGQATVTLEIVA
ncbi:hypothetical protein V7O66_01785 [Methanolobus sp. ZRKC3]|uniref:hypothetical protein n=1 Tax=Methanolobus sp. ZRKC3 TaxID=3125786 RepID=UPI0032507178